MNLKAIEDKLYDITEMFFKGATIIWTEQINTKPRLPYVTLSLNGISKTSFPVIDKDGNRFYPCSTTLEVNLYTKGRQVTFDKKTTANYANTAVSDLMDFFVFLESDKVIDILAESGIDITLNPPIRDLKYLENDSRYRYRAMAEATVSFSMEADGPYGTSSMETIPNSSGGGNTELNSETVDVIDTVEINEGGKKN